MSDLEILLTIIAGVATGVLSAVFGVGGGQVVIPFLVLVLGTTQHVAEGTSLAVIVPTALVGAWVHYRHGYVHTRAALIVAVSGVAGAVAGALLANELDGELLRRIYALFVLWVAWRFLKPQRRAAEVGD